MVFFRRVAVVAVVAQLTAASPAALPADESLAAAGAAVVRNDAGAVVEVRFKGPAVERPILSSLQPCAVAAAAPLERHRAGLFEGKT